MFILNLNNHNVASFSRCIEAVDVPVVRFSCTGMVHYGLLINDNILLFINTVGLILNLIYLLVYISVVEPKV